MKFSRALLRDCITFVSGHQVELAASLACIILFGGLMVSCMSPPRKEPKVVEQKAIVVTPPKQQYSWKVKIIDVREDGACKHETLMEHIEGDNYRFTTLRLLWQGRRCVLVGRFGRVIIQRQERKTMQVFQQDKALAKAWVDGVTLDDKAKAQIMNLAAMPFVFKHVAVMPDAHFGIGATIGSVVATRGAIIPAAVGVDIGCGMIAARTTLSAKDLPDSLSELRHDIERGIPVGFNEHHSEERLQENFIRLPNWKGTHEAWQTLHKKGAPNKKAVAQLGTLGGGNHFIELCLDEAQCVWIMLHSGSRGTGNMVGNKHIEIARQLMQKYFITLPDKDLAYLTVGTQQFDDYYAAMTWCQEYAAENRRVMLELVVRTLQHRITNFSMSMEAVNCHHNYTAIETHFGEEVFVTRKGAVNAEKGVLGIIPGSMGAKSFIVRGLGNPESFCSCSHGAGRVMSRGQAKREITLAQHEKATAGVECRKDAGVLDESPAAYKDIDAVMAAQEDLVEVVHTLKQVMCIKG